MNDPLADASQRPDPEQAPAPADEQRGGPGARRLDDLVGGVAGGLRQAGLDTQDLAELGDLRLDRLSALGMGALGDVQNLELGVEGGGDRAGRSRRRQRPGRAVERQQDLFGNLARPAGRRAISSGRCVS